MKLTIEKERVLEAAESCSSDAKQILKILFPDVFESEYHEWELDKKMHSDPLIRTTDLVGLDNSNLFLDNYYEWDIVNASADNPSNQYLRAKKKS